MSSFIITFIVGALCVFLGIRNMKGDISSLHSYHRHRVSEEDVKPFGKQVGIGTIIIGGSIIITSIFSALTLWLNNQIFLKIGLAIMFIGLIVGIVITFRAMIKYNKGIF